jgi:hypothetical protein
LAVTRTITVHAFDDERIHMAPAQLGRLKQGRLNTLCGRLAVTELSPFAAAAAASARCRVCFAKIDESGHVKPGALPAKPATAKPAKAKPSTVATMAAAPAPRRRPAKLKR